MVTLVCKRKLQHSSWKEGIFEAINMRVKRGYCEIMPLFMQMGKRVLLSYMVCSAVLQCLMKRGLREPLVLPLCRGSDLAYLRRSFQSYLEAQSSERRQVFLPIVPVSVFIRAVSFVSWCASIRSVQCILARDKQSLKLTETETKM